MSGERGVLYVATCATAAAPGIGTLIDLAQLSGWDCCLLATPNAVNFLNLPELERQTGHPVRHEYRRPDEVSPFPAADGVVVAGASFNTVNKLAAGIADTLVLSTVTEAMGAGLPVVVAPFCNEALAKHVAWRRSIDTLREMGVAVLVGPGLYEPHTAVDSTEALRNYPWRTTLITVEEMTEARRR